MSRLQGTSSSILQYALDSNAPKLSTRPLHDRQACRPKARAAPPSPDLLDVLALGLAPARPAKRERSQAARGLLDIGSDSGESLGHGIEMEDEVEAEEEEDSEAEVAVEATTAADNVAVGLGFAAAASSSGAPAASSGGAPGASSSGAPAEASSRAPGPLPAGHLEAHLGAPSGGAEEGEAARAPRRIQRPGQPLLTFAIAGHGCIEVDSKNRSLNAHCNCLTPPNDHRTPSMPECRMNRVMKKAPLGFLIAWLRAGPRCRDRQAHVAHRLSISKEERTAARQWLEGQPALRPLLEEEAGALDATVGEVREPERIT